MMTREEMIELHVLWGMSRERAIFEQYVTEAYRDREEATITLLAAEHPEWMPATYNED